MIDGYPVCQSFKWIDGTRWKYNKWVEKTLGRNNPDRDRIIYGKENAIYIKGSGEASRRGEWWDDAGHGRRSYVCKK